jgi:hypothetical protein
MKKRSLLVYLLATLHLFIGINATVSGFMFMIKPDGSLLKMEPGWLEGSPFNNYFIPGLVLFLVLGNFSLVIFYGLLMPHSKWSALEVYPARHWAWIASLSEGWIVISWILIQMALTHFFWLQPIMLTIGLLIVLLSLNSSVANFYSLKQKARTNAGPH